MAHTRMDQATKDQLKKNYYLTLFLGFSMAFSIAIYLVAGNFILSLNSHVSGSPTVYPNVRVILAGFCLLGFAAVRLISARVQRAARYLTVRLPLEINRKRLLSSFITAHIVPFGFSSFIAFSGFILSLLTKERDDIYLFCTLSFVTFIFAVPRFSSWESRFDEIWEDFNSKLLRTGDRKTAILSTDEPKVFPVSTWVKILATIIFAPVIALCAFFIIKPVYNGTILHAGQIIGVLFKGAIAYFCVYILKAAYNMRFEVYKDKIKNVGLFKAQELATKDIAGFRIRRTPNSGNDIIFLSKTSKDNNLGTALTFKDSDVLTQWAREHFINPDEIEAKKEMDAVLHDRAFGSTEQERSETLKREKRLVNILGIAAGAVFVLCIRIHFLYSTVVPVILILLTLISVICLRFSFGRIKFFLGKKSAYPQIGFVILFIGIAFFLQAIWDWPTVGWLPLWLPFVLISASLFLVFKFSSPDVRGQGPTLFLMLCCLLIGYGSTVTLNGVLDNSSPAFYKAEVVNKHIDGDIRTGESYYLKLGGWGPVETWENVSVTEKQYDEYKINNFVELALYKGAFGIPWYRVMKTVAQAQAPKTEGMSIKKGGALGDFQKEYSTPINPKIHTSGPVRTEDRSMKASAGIVIVRHVGRFIKYSNNTI